jgi:hypothetical protein
MTGSAKTLPRGFRVQRTEDGESLVIPVVRIRLLMAFLSVWLVFWVLAGAVSAMSVDVSNLEPGDALFAVIWTLALATISSLLLWMVTGRETVRFRGGDLEVVRRAFLLSRRWLYSGPAIRDLRVEPRPWLGTPRGGAFPFFGNSRFGAIRFSYRGRTQDLALGLGESDAGEIVAWLRKGLSRTEGTGDGG